MSGAKRLLEAREIRDEVIRLYRKGSSTSDIGKLMGCTAFTVRLSLMRWGVPLRSRYFRGFSCADCLRPSDGRKRCGRCAKVFYADQERERYWDRKSRRDTWRRYKQKEAR